MTTVGYFKTTQRHRKAYLNVPLPCVQPMLINYFIQCTFTKLESAKSHRYWDHQLEWDLLPALQSLLIKKGKIKCKVVATEDTLPWYQLVLSQRSRTGRRYILKDLWQRIGLWSCGHCLGKSQMHRMGHQEGPAGIHGIKWSWWHK